MLTDQTFSDSYVVRHRNHMYDLELVEDAPSQYVDRKNGDLVENGISSGRADAVNVVGHTVDAARERGIVDCRLSDETGIDRN